MNLRDGHAGLCFGHRQNILCRACAAHGGAEHTGSGRAVAGYFYRGPNGNGPALHAPRRACLTRKERTIVGANVVLAVIPSKSAMATFRRYVRLEP